jgi:flavodoxin
MKTLVIADSAYGNTIEVARRIADTFALDGRMMRPSAFGLGDLDGVDLLIIGSPTQGGRPLTTITALIKSLPQERARGLRFAAFDTRVDARKQAFALRLLVTTIGYAGPKIAKQLKAAGCREVAPPEGFVVEDKEGPLRAGELERAAEWARQLQSAAIT